MKLQTMFTLYINTVKVIQTCFSTWKKELKSNLEKNLLFTNLEAGH